MPEHPTERKDAPRDELAAGPPDLLEAGERPGVDWMDFGKPDGGPTRRVVHLGIHEMESERG